MKKGWCVGTTPPFTFELVARNQGAYSGGNGLGHAG
jgi:hypothetical protein